MRRADAAGACSASRATASRKRDAFSPPAPSPRIPLTVNICFGPLTCVVTTSHRTRLADVLLAARTRIPEIPSSRNVCVYLGGDPDPARWARVSSQLRISDVVVSAALQVELHVKIRTASRVRAARSAGALVCALRAAARAATIASPRGGGLAEDRRRLTDADVHAVTRAAIASHHDAPVFIEEHDRDVHAAFARACDRPVFLPFGSRTVDVFHERQCLAAAAGGLSVPAALDAALRVWGWQVFYTFVFRDLRADAPAMEPAEITHHVELARFVLGAPASPGHAWTPPPGRAVEALVRIGAFLRDVCERRTSPLGHLDDHLRLREVLAKLYKIVVDGGGLGIDCASVLGGALQALAGVQDIAHCPDLELDWVITHRTPWPINDVGQGSCQDASDADRVIKAAFPLLSCAMPYMGGGGGERHPHRLLGDDTSDDLDDDAAMPPLMPEMPRAEPPPAGADAAGPQRHVHAPPPPARPVPAAARAIMLETAYADSSDDDELDELPAATVLYIMRANILDSSIWEVTNLDVRALAHPLAAIEVVFLDEAGQGHGVIRDWVTAVFEALAAPEMGLFVRAPGNAFVLHPSPAAEVMHPLRERESVVTAWRPPYTWMELYTFVGRMWAIAMRLNIRVGYHFSDAAWRMLQGRGIGLAHLDELEPDVARSCRAILRETDDDALRAMALPGFTAPHPLGDLRPITEPAAIELIPGGADIEVVSRNAVLFTQLLAEHYLGRWDMPMHAMVWIRDGMLWGADTRVRRHTILKALADVTTNAFNIAAGGAVSLRVAEWRMCVDVVADPSVPEPGVVAERFWEAVRVMDAPTRRALARFWTGESTLPPAADRDRLRWQLHLSTSVAMRLPSSHTCFRQLHVPTSAIAPTLSAHVLHTLLVAALNGHDGEIFDP